MYWKPDVQVAGKLDRLFWRLIIDAEPVAASMNSGVPMPTGASTAIQYFEPEVTLAAGTVTEFQALFTGLTRTAEVIRVPGVLLVVLLYKPSTTWLAVLLLLM